MKKLLLKRTDDGTCHLYENDSKKEGFTWLGSASKVEKVHGEKYCLLSDKNGKTLYGILSDMVFKQDLTRSAQVEFIDSSCVYKPDIASEWFTKQFQGNKIVTIPLGKVMSKFVIHYPLAQSVNSLVGHFFVSDRGLLSFFAKDELYTFGPYREVEEVSSRILAKRDDGFYDIWLPNCGTNLQPKDEGGLCIGNSVFVWNAYVKGWARHKGFKIFGKNVIYCIIRQDLGEIIQIWEIVKGIVVLRVEASDWYFTENSDLCANGVIYKILPSGMVDLNNPVPTMKRKVKNFFLKLTAKAAK